MKINIYICTCCCCFDPSPQVIYVYHWPNIENLASKINLSPPPLMASDAVCYKEDVLLLLIQCSLVIVGI